VPSQPTLFDAVPVLIPTDPNVDQRDVPRLSRQCRVILAMLREGPQTNDALSRVARKYTGRVSDLRAAGYRIKCTRVGGGVHLYELEKSP
jgi:hypothetical protein